MREEQRPQSWWQTTAIFSTANFSEMIAWGHLTAFTPLFLSQELRTMPGETVAWTGALAAASMLVAVPLGPFWGVLADRYSRRLLILRSAYIQLIAYVIIALSQSVWAFLAARLLFGFAFGNTALMIAAMTEHAPSHRISTAIGIFNTSYPLAVSIGPLIGAVLAHQLGLRGMFLADAGLIVISILCTTFLFRDHGRRDLVTPLGEKLAAVGRQVALVPPIKWNFITWLFASTGIFVIEPFAPLFIEREAVAIGLDPRDAIGIVLALGGAFTAIVTPLAGTLADRIGPTRAIPLIGALGMIIALALALPLGFFWVAGALILRSLPQALNNTALYAHLARHVDAEFRSAILSLSPIPRNTAMLIGPAIGAAVSGFGLLAVLAVAAASYLTTIVCSLKLHRVSERAIQQVGISRIKV